MKSFVLGKSGSGLPILGHMFGKSPRHVLVLGGVHGDETEGVAAALGLVNALAPSFDLDLTVHVIPAFNPDGILAKTRVNSRSVDLNRNLPTKDWTAEVLNPRYPPGPSACSEPETQALVSFLNTHKPVFILSLHSWKPLLNVNGECIEEAGAIQKHTGYMIEKSMGYPTPGCLGTYAGMERGLPTLTYEIERGLSIPEILKTHVPAIVDALKVTEAK